MRKPTPSEANAAYRAEVAKWIGDIEKRFGVSTADVARRGGVQPSTLYRWIDLSKSHVPSQAVILRIANAFGVPGPGANPIITGFSEAGVEPMGPVDASLPINQSWWRAKDRALELAGYLPGDRLLLDQAAPPRPGDVVIAQIKDFDRGVAETVIRIFAPPFLVTRTMDPALSARTDYVDNDKVSISGPVVRLVRDRVA